MIVWQIQKNDGLVIDGANLTDGMIISEDQTKAELNGVVYMAHENCVLIEDPTFTVNEIGAIYDFSTKTFTNSISEEK